MIPLTYNAETTLRTSIAFVLVTNSFTGSICSGHRSPMFVGVDE
jgi:hypothetical protein